MESDAIVIGGGVAGLAAAGELTRAGLQVIVLEARDRLGGRVFTLHDPEVQVPIELGAEFVHGRPAEIWDLLRGTDAGAREITGQDWCVRGGKRGPCDAFEKVDAVLGQMKRDRPDRSFLEFLDACCRGENNEARQWALAYVRGFHLAHVDEISVNSLVQGTDADEEIGGDQPFRITAGYDYLIRNLAERCYRQNLKLHLNTCATRVQWRRGQVEVEAVAPSEQALSFTAGAAVITLPLSVLQSPLGSRGVVEFAPGLKEKQQALDLLAMGKVVRVTLQFRERFWEAQPVAFRELRFLLSEDEVFPTWWTSRPTDAAVITGWAPAESAEALSGRPQDALLQAALEALARIVRMPFSRLQPLLVHGWVHDWQSDPFARGAYSYVKVGGEQAQRELAQALADTLFFAGEATHFEGHHGTVHGAIATGHRAAREVLEGRERRTHRRKYG